MCLITRLPFEFESTQHSAIIKESWERREKVLPSSHTQKMVEFPRFIGIIFLLSVSFATNRVVFPQCGAELENLQLRKRSHQIPAVNLLRCLRACRGCLERSAGIEMDSHSVLLLPDTHIKSSTSLLHTPESTTAWIFSLGPSDR